MCVVSNAGDHYGTMPGTWPWQPMPPAPPPSAVPEPFRQKWIDITRDTEIQDLKGRVEALEKLLAEAKKFDAETGQPNCEMDEKMDLLRKLAKQFGVEIKLP